MSRRSRLFVTTAVKDWGQSPLSRVPDSDVFLPSDLSPALWLDASDTTTITESGGAVSQWNNKGSLGNFTQATGAVQPTTGATTLNGQNVIDFAADYFVAADTNEWKFLHDGTKYIFACVWKAGTSSDPNAAYTLIGSTAGVNTARGMIILYDDRTVASRNNLLGFQVANGAGGSDFPVSLLNDNTFTANQFQALTAIFDPGNATANNRLEFFLDAGSGTKGNTSTGTPSASNPTAALEIGRGATFGVMTGSIAELIIVSGTNATETNRVKLRDYLDDKWAVY